MLRAILPWETPCTPPTVELDQATFIGISDGVTTEFLGIPYAQAPVGNLRFNLPVAVEPYTGTHQATSFGAACPQQDNELPDMPFLFGKPVRRAIETIYRVVSPFAEDCLSINVVIPEGTKPDAKLPVVVWIYGGGFQVGATSSYDGAVIVERSIELGEPVVYVSMNYRVSAYGFLAGKDVKQAGVGNLGLQDQRLALHWVQKYITSFGGDPEKVTIWGESAGAISAALHMLTNGGNTEGLFRGAFMQSGSPIPVGDISHGQAEYDELVSRTGCSDAADTLQCLREVPFDELQDAVDQSPGIFSSQGLRLAWLPRADGGFLASEPQKLVKQGSVASIPFVTGNCDDEGTLFSLANVDIITEEQFRDHIISTYIPDVSADDPRLERAFQLYPADITRGSPFNTSVLNALTPQYKRLAAVQGDLVFQSPRRFFLENRADKQPAWSFLHKRLKVTPYLGSTHGTDVINVYGGGELADFLINFVNHLDPNGKTNGTWPRYSLSSPHMLTFHDGLTPYDVALDNHRAEGMRLLTELSLEHPL